MQRSPCSSLTCFRHRSRWVSTSTISLVSSSCAVAFTTAAHLPGSCSSAGLPRVWAFPLPVKILECNPLSTIPCTLYPASSAYPTSAPCSHPVQYLSSSLVDGPSASSLRSCSIWPALSASGMSLKSFEACEGVHIHRSVIYNEGFEVIPSSHHRLLCYLF